MRQYFTEEKKRSLFPNMDFKDPQNHKRMMKVSDMDYFDWLWFHPSAFKLVYYGSNAVAITLFTATTIYGVMTGNIFLSVIFGFLLSIFANDLYNKFRKYRFGEKTNLYDLYIRDYGELK